MKADDSETCGLSGSRRAVLRAVSASIALGLCTQMSMVRVLRGAPESPKDTSGYDAYFGNYRLPESHMLGVDRFIDDQGRTTLLLSDYRSGVVRRLFPVSDTEFVMGPGFDVQSPPELRVRFRRDQQGKVTGVSLEAAHGQVTVAERVPLQEEEVAFSDDDVRLAGTLITPMTKGAHPAIVLLHGSGPLTRYSFGPYPHFFTSLGLAVLIYDKRGSGSSGGTLLDASTGNLAQLPAAFYPDDLTNDALAALRFLRGRKGISADKIGFWGSSEGGMLTTQVAARSKDVAFIVNSSGFMGPLWQTILYQGAAQLRATGSTEREIEEALAFNKLWMRVAQTGEQYELFVRQRERLIKENSPWLFWWSRSFSSLELMRWDWNHILAFSPLPALTHVACPTLGVFGELDQSTDALDAAKSMRETLSKTGNGDVTVKVFPNASHSLAEMPVGARMAPGVFETLGSWLRRRVFG